MKKQAVEVLSEMVYNEKRLMKEGTDARFYAGMRMDMRFGKKRITAVFAVVLCLFVLAACGQGGTKIVFTTGLGKNEIFRIGRESCTKEEVMVYLTNTQNQYESVFGEEIWDISHKGITLEQNVKEMILASLTQIKTMYLLAEEKGIVLDESEEEKVKAAAEEYFGSLNDTERELMGVRQETIEKMYREYRLASKVYQEIIKDINPEISDDEARTITVQYIFTAVSDTDSAGNLVSEAQEKKQKAYEKISEAQALAVSGEQDFAELASKYSEDETITCSFGKGEMEPAFETAAFMLETDEISNIVETEKGYYLIKCLSTFDRAETDANKLEIVEQRRREAFGQEYDAFAESLAKNMNEKAWDELTMLHDSEVTTSSFSEVYEKYFLQE